MDTNVVCGSASAPSAGCIDIQYLAHPRTDRYGPFTISTLGRGAGTLEFRTGGGCLGGLISGTFFVGKIIVAALVGIPLEILVDYSADSISSGFSPSRTVQCAVPFIPITPVPPSSQV